MRKIRSATLVLFVLVITQPWNWAYAYEIYNNPDRKISIGVGYDHAEGTTDYTFRAFHMNGFSKQRGDSLGLDFRAPMTSFFTLVLRGSAYKNRSDLFTTERLEQNGYTAGIGFRIFIP